MLEDKARIDIGGPMSETKREGIYLADKLLETQPRLIIVYTEAECDHLCT